MQGVIRWTGSNEHLLSTCYVSDIVPHIITSFSFNRYKIGPIIIPILEVRKLIEKLSNFPRITQSIITTLYSHVSLHLPSQKLLVT